MKISPHFSAEEHGSSTTTMSKPNNLGKPVLVHTERSVNGKRYLVSTRPELVSVDFVSNAYNGGALHWTEPMDSASTRLMIDKSTVLGLYRLDQSDQSVILADVKADQLQQVGMVRLVTDHVTHAYLTDLFVTPELQKSGLGLWLAQCCKEFIDKMPFLRKAMLSLSNPKRSSLFAQEQLEMSVLQQDPENNVVLIRRRQKARL